MAQQRRGRGAGLLMFAAGVCATLSWQGAFVQQGAASTLRRRELLLMPAGILVAGAQSAWAIDPCKDGANNCFSTASKGKNQLQAWTPAAGTSRADAVAQLKAALDAYPQKGQD